MPLGEGRGQRTVKQGVFSNAVTSELNVAERDDFFQKVEEGILLAKALWLGCTARVWHRLRAEGLRGWSLHVCQGLTVLVKEARWYL